MLKKYLFSAFLFFFFSVQTNGQVQLAGGASINYAPYASYGNNSGSGMLVSFFGDVIINRVFIARGQTSKLLVNTFKGGELNSSFAIIGSMGYNAVLSDGKLEIPFMATLGYMNIWYPVLNDEFYDASLQVGGMITPT